MTVEKQKKNQDGGINFADNWARVFVMIKFLTFGEAQIIGGIVPNSLLVSNH